MGGISWCNNVVKRRVYSRWSARCFNDCLPVSLSARILSHTRVCPRSIPLSSPRSLRAPGADLGSRSLSSTAIWGLLWRWSGELNLITFFFNTQRSIVLKDWIAEFLDQWSRIDNLLVKPPVHYFFSNICLSYKMTETIRRLIRRNKLPFQQGLRKFVKWLRMGCVAESNRSIFKSHPDGFMRQDPGRNIFQIVRFASFRRWNHGRRRVIGIPTCLEMHDPGEVPRSDAPVQSAFAHQTAKEDIISWTFTLVRRSTATASLS